MPVDEALLASARQADKILRSPATSAAWRREIVAMLPEARDDARRVLAVVDAMLAVKLPPREPLAGEPSRSQPDAA